MKVFISWSGAESLPIAELLSDWLVTVIPTVKCFVSDQIDKGSPWFETIKNELRDTRYGIFIVTPHNKASQWLHYEAGAISNQERAYVATFLVDVRPVEVGAPLNLFQCTLWSSKADILKLFAGINGAADPVLHTREKLRFVFDKWWDDYHPKLMDLARAAGEAPAARDDALRHPRTTTDEEIARAIAVKDDELRHLRTRTDEEIARIVEIKDAEIAKLMRELATDDLTRVPNRRQIREKYEKHMKVLRAPYPEHRPFSLAYLDIVNFKEVNERFLHERADAILVQFTSVVSKALRDEDTLFRLAGDQFALLLSGATVSEVASFVALRINRRLSEMPFFVDIHPTTKKDIEVRLECRFGITDGILDEEVEACLKRADAALRLAKREKLVISDKERSGIRIVTKAMVLDNPELIAAEPMIRLPD